MYAVGLWSSVEEGLHGETVAYVHGHLPSWKREAAVPPRPARDREVEIVPIRTHTFVDASYGVESPATAGYYRVQNLTDASHPLYGPDCPTLVQSLHSFGV